MESPQILLPPISGKIGNIMLVQEAACASLAQALYLKDAASTTLDLIAAAERDEDQNLNCLATDAVAFIAGIWRSYLGSSSPQLWPSRELRNTIVDATFMLRSAKKFVTGRAQARRLKPWLARRIKIALDAPKMKAYHTQLSKCAHIAQVEISKLNLEAMTSTASAGYNQQWTVINITFVSGSAVAIGGGDAHVYTRI